MTDPLQKIFKEVKPIIGMVHVPALPGSYQYDAAKGMRAIREKARKDALIMQEHGVDGVMFCNEYDRPYTFKIHPTSIAAMTDCISRVAEELTIPYGVNMLWDPIATVSVANAVDAHFVREVFTGVYASDMGLWQPDIHEVRKILRDVGNDKLELFANIVPEFCGSLDVRPLKAVARSVVTSSLFNVLLISGLTAGMEADLDIICEVKSVVPEAAVLVNTGVRINTVEKYLSVADGGIVGTYFKKDGITWNDADPERVKNFMQVVRDFRKKLADSSR